MAKTEVIASLRVPGYHRWPEAPEDVWFLRDLHRHEFHVTVWKEVSHANRDVEIIKLKAAVASHFTAHYEALTSPPGGFKFDRQSCEQLALRLMDDLELSRVRVLEDGENGAEVTA